MALVAIMKVTIGFVAVLMMSSTFLVTVCPLPKLRQRFWNTVSQPMMREIPFYFDQVLIVYLAMVAEAAVVGIADELTGQAVNAFVALKEGNETNDEVRKDLVMQVRKSIGPFAAPKAVFVVEDLPKTRSGKIMRRILRKILSGEEDSLGDISTVSKPFLLFKNFVCSNMANSFLSCLILAWSTRSLLPSTRRVASDWTK